MNCFEKVLQMGRNKCSAWKNKNKTKQKTWSSVVEGGLNTQHCNQTTTELGSRDTVLWEPCSALRYLQAPPLSHPAFSLLPSSPTHFSSPHSIKPEAAGTSCSSGGGKQQRQTGKQKPFLRPTGIQVKLPLTLGTVFLSQSSFPVKYLYRSFQRHIFYLITGNKLATKNIAGSGPVISSWNSNYVSVATFTGALSKLCQMLNWDQYAPH